jgi:hypothetical protein
MTHQQLKNKIINILMNARPLMEAWHEKDGSITINARNFDKAIDGLLQLHQEAVREVVGRIEEELNRYGSWNKKTEKMWRTLKKEILKEL